MSDDDINEIRIGSDVPIYNVVDDAKEFIEDGETVEYQALGRACNALREIVGALHVQAAKGEIPDIEITEAADREHDDDHEEGASAGLRVRIAPADS